MNKWEYKREKDTSRAVTGDHRCMIMSVSESTSQKTGLPMIVMEIRPNGAKFNVRHWVVKNDKFNINMTKIFDSFDMEEGCFDFSKWRFAMGAARFIIDEKGYTKVHYFIDRNKAEDLPAWIDNYSTENSSFDGFSTPYSTYQDDNPFVD